jgi:hypothetical protein
MIILDYTDFFGFHGLFAWSMGHGAWGMGREYDISRFED